MPEDEKQKKSTVESAPAAKNATQSYLDIDHFREGVMVLKDGGMKVVLKTSAINFELKAEIERDSIIYGYQNFLNSLDFPIQIIVQSRRLDLDKYLEDLSKKSISLTNELLKMQITDYVEFIKTIIAQGNIMQKSFYVVVNHYPGGFKKINSLSRIISPTTATISISNFADEKKYLNQKVETVSAGLRSIGLGVMVLDTQPLIELFYGIYNPQESVTQKIVNLTDFEAELIERGLEEMNIG